MNNSENNLIEPMQSSTSQSNLNQLDQEMTNSNEFQVSPISSQSPQLMHQPPCKFIINKRKSAN